MNKNTTLDDLAVVIGFSNTLKLAVWFGNGSNLYVPMEVSPNSVLAKLIGISPANALSKEWGGKHISVPGMSTYNRDARRKLIARMLEQRFGTREIATHLNMSERRVQQVCRELEADGLIAPVDKPDSSPLID